MNNLNLDLLITTPKQNIVNDVNNLFNNLLNELQNYLSLEPINPKVTIYITTNLKEDKKDFYNLGVRRRLTKNQFQIEISKDIHKFLQLILLREAYLCFVPFELRKKEIIQIVIHEIIENDLSKLEVINEWKTLIRSKIINYDYLSAQFDKLNKFFKLKGTEKTQSPTQFFFLFLRRNISLFKDKMNDFYDMLLEEYVYKTSKTLHNDEIIETIRVIVKIFYYTKFLRQNKDYIEYFQDLKEKGIISSNLSKRKFGENLRWINKNTIIAPSYAPIYHKVNIAVVFSILKFNPILHRKDIYNILDRIPFLTNLAFIKNGFSEEIRSYFVIPKIYLKDLLKFIEKMYDFGYIINKECYIWKQQCNIINLNYFREYFKDLRKIINPNHKDYDNRFELKFSGIYEKPNKNVNLNLLEWLIFERVSHTSTTGFGFERRVETLQSLKDELLNHIESERVLISNLRSSLNKLSESEILKEKFYDFLERNKKFGSFYTNYMLQKVFEYLNLFENLITQNPEIENLAKLKEFLNSNKISHLIEENLYFKSRDIQSIVFKDFFPLYFNSNQEYTTLKKSYFHFFNFIKSCWKLKIFSIDSMKNIIRNEKLTEEIYKTKEKKLKQSFETFKPYKITNQKIDSIFKRFLEKDLISPELINTITVSSFAKYHPFLLLKDSIKVTNIIEKLTMFFPRVFIEYVKNLFNNKSYIMIFGYFLNIKEKELFTSILYNLFKEDLINVKRYFTSGVYSFVLIKDFYDFDRNEFFYAKDLFKQSFLYIQKILGDLLYPLQEIKTSSQERFWSKEKNIINLVKEVDRRVSYEFSDFEIKRIKELTEFDKNLNTILLNSRRFKDSQQAQFFKNFIKAIKFIPNFQAFGLNQFFLYIYPSNIEEIDFKHLLINTFQFFKYPTIINGTNSFLIKYIFPYGNPNMKHLNWYTKTKRIIREYCLFSIKRIYQILNFDYNFSADGWNYDSNQFKIYIQNILFNPNYKIEFSKTKEFNLVKQDFVGPNSAYFQALSEIYSYRAADIKSFLGSRKYSVINNIKSLITNNLIFPYISLKNLGFQDKIYIILPNVKEEINSLIIKIFNFFNYGFIYEIEGEFFIHGFDEVIKFQNGMMIKLFLPICEIDEFFKLFDLLFEYLEINNYIVLTDLIKGKDFLKAIYGSLAFLDSYNPLINLNWNNKDKIWMNHKLFTENFEKIYPDLLCGVRKEENINNNR